MEDLKTVQTTKGELKYYRDWEMEGHFVMINPQTLKRYRYLTSLHPEPEEYVYFCAFNQEQFNRGYKRLVERGFIKEGDKIMFSRSAQFYGTKECLDRVFEFYRRRKQEVKNECDPQEVYFYEFNNHECMFSDDEEAYRLVCSYFGEDAAEKIKRYRF